ncbi:MAG: tRNA epoxyqueuosine(34) reductase QueG [Candidatus Didemnitutus sp.]|nr:tRNA epoxyqueuosine(34) reductase QueG [Candidatus Didemnitutus sp.]
MSAAQAARFGGERREELRGRLLACGFDVVRFASAAPAGGEALRAWLAAGMHADMAWMERTVDKRGDASLVLEGARSVVVLGVNYRGSEAFERELAATALPRWARYALHEDYHDTIKPGLVAAGRVLEEWCGAAATDYRFYTDTGPVLERGFAARAGAGFRGKNGMLISREHGNWLFLAVILTRVPIEPDAPLRPDVVRVTGDEPTGLLCGKCTRCIEACPTAAITAPGVVDARRCISYQTIENKGVIPRELRAGIGARVYGCDVCLEVCPWNRFAREGRKTLLVAREELAALTLGDLLALTPEKFAATFRRTAVKRLKLSGLLRNACVVAGNSGDAAHVPGLVALARHELPLVRAHAVWAVRRIAGERAVELLAAVRAVEADATVLAEYAAADAGRT